MNFSEYMAILSGNTDLLDKAKLEKKIASLEGERKSFNKGRRESEFKLESKTSEFNNNAEKIRGMQEDWEKFTSVAIIDGKGNRVNALKIIGLETTDEKAIGARLQEIAKNATTGGRYKEVGELYGFKVMVVSEETLKSELAALERKIQLELAPPVQEVEAQKENGVDVEKENEKQTECQQPSVISSHIRDRIIVCRPDIPQHRNVPMARRTL